MAENNASGAAAATGSGKDPVATAQEWLARNGVVATEPLRPEPLIPEPLIPEPRTPEPCSGRPLSSRPEVEGQRFGGRGAGFSGRSRRTVDAAPDANPESVARNIVLHKLAAQARTRHELAQALAARQVPEEAAANVLERFEQVGLIDDAGFARDWVQSRQQRRYLSKSALRRELQVKGVDRDVIDAAVAQVGGSDETSAARALAEKKLRSVAGLPRAVQYRRLAGALARRGFSGAVTASVLGPILDAAGGAEEESSGTL